LYVRGVDFAVAVHVRLRLTRRGRPPTIHVVIEIDKVLNVRNYTVVVDIAPVLTTAGCSDNRVATRTIPTGPGEKTLSHRLLQGNAINNVGPKTSVVRIIPRYMISLRWNQGVVKC
jgi:hypothetical protein